MTAIVDFRPEALAPTCRRFAESDEFVRFIIGPVGSGKSTACVREIARRALRQKRGPDGKRHSRFAVIRNTYSQLRDTTRKTFEEWIPHNLGTWHEQRFAFTMEFDDVECEVLFRALDRPEDVKKLLSLELTGAYINEAREIPKHVLDVLETRVGRYPSKAQGGASWFGIWADTNPWHSGHWGAKLFAKNLPGYRSFRQPGGRAKNAENVENLPRDYYPRLCSGKDAEWVRVYVDGEDATSDVGAIWGAWVADLEKRGGICAFDHPLDGVFTHWDLGRSDSTAIWFWRVNARGVPDVLDHYENSGQGLSHFFGVVDRKPYRYAKHFLPHDARAKTLATQQSVLEQCVEHWGSDKVAITHDLSIADGISAARWVLEQPIQIHERCAVPARFEHSGVDALREYRYEWDEDTQAFSTKPLHNWASHSADAFRYLSVEAKRVEQLTRKAAPPPEPGSTPLGAAIPVNFDELFSDRERARR
jgi:hypothetical protein